MHFFTTLLLTAILLAGCGISDTKRSGSQSTTDQSTTQTNDDTNLSIPEDATKIVTACSADDTTDKAFSDSFVTMRHADIDWPEAERYSTLTVADIERIFTDARAKDPTVHTAMVLPPQAEWEAMDHSQKVLYLVNKARCDRGIKPFEGLDPAITDVAQTYADFLVEHPDLYAQSPHEADGRTPFERMQDAGVSIGVNADFFAYGENIASIGVGTSLHTYPLVPESEAKAVYGWLYEDSAQGYGHRKFTLANALVENAGATDAEGVIGVGFATRHYIDENNIYWSTDIIVMDGFDPRSGWDNNLAHVQKTPLYR